jgi:hypothetical protein
VKRPAEERKRLPPELLAFAQSDETRLRLRRPRKDQGKVRDPRESFVIPGVKNADARAVFDARARELSTLWDSGHADDAARRRVGELLRDARRLLLHRAKRIVSFEAFVEQVTGIEPQVAATLVDEARQRANPHDGDEEELTEREIATWLRTEAGLYEGDIGARATVHGRGEGKQLTFTIGLSSASLGIAGAGARHAPLAREQREREEHDAAKAAARAAYERRDADAADEAMAEEVEPGSSDETATARATADDTGEPVEGAAAPAEVPASDAPRAGARLLRRKGGGALDAARAEEPRRESSPRARRESSRAGRDEGGGRREPFAEGRHVARAGRRAFGENRERSFGGRDERRFNSQRGREDQPSERPFRKKPAFADKDKPSRFRRDAPSETPSYGREHGTKKRPLGEKPFAKKTFGKKRPFGQRTSFDEGSTFGGKPRGKGAPFKRGAGDARPFRGETKRGADARPFRGEAKHVEVKRGEAKHVEVKRGEVKRGETKGATQGAGQGFGTRKLSPRKKRERDDEE